MRWAWRNGVNHRVTLNGLYPDCALHYRAKWLWAHSGAETQRNTTASIRDLVKEGKVQEHRGAESLRLEGCQGHLRELSREADLWRTLAKPIVPCVCVCAGAVSAGAPMHEVTHACTPPEVWMKHSMSVKFKDQSWSASMWKSNGFILGMKENRKNNNKQWKEKSPRD